MFYAQLNGSSICVAVTQSAGPLIGAQFIPIASLNVDLLGMKWTGSAWTAP